jgi:hypothetical protein
LKKNKSILQHKHNLPEPLGHRKGGAKWEVYSYKCLH